MNAYRLIDPLDVLMVRGNRLFGGGVHGERLMPPWPSVFAGALASQALAQRVGDEEKTLLDSLPGDVRKRLNKGKELVAQVEVEPLGHALRLVAIVVGPAAGPK